MVQIKHKSAALKDTESARKILGQKVLAKDGSKIGNIAELHIHPKKLTVEGIVIQKGVFLESDYIGKNYISSLSKKGAVLSVNPLTELIGKEVVDARAKKVGKVKKLYRTKKTNVVHSLIVSRGALKKDLHVKNSDIKTIGKRIVLKRNVS